MEGNSMVLDIQKFAEGGAEGTGTGESATVAQSQETGENNPVAGDEKSGGRTIPQSAPQTAPFTQGSRENGEETVTLDSIFEKYPELKKEADKRTQKAVQGRVHQINKSMQNQNNIIDKLMVHHGAKSIEELNEKLDNSLAEEFAIQHGVNEDMGKELFNLRVKNMQDARAREFYENKQKAEAQYNAWINESNDVKAVYADFDLEKELENPDFRRLISADERYRMPMKQIYEMLHHDEIVETAKKNTAAAYAKSTAQIQSRPSENGLGNQAAVNGSMDVSKLTKKERAELAKRAARGERITF